MKLTKQKLKQIIKEELLRELMQDRGDASALIRAISGLWREQGYPKPVPTGTLLRDAQELIMNTLTKYPPDVQEAAQDYLQEYARTGIQDPDGSYDYELELNQILESPTT
jgi:hypothetical protein